MRSVWCLLSHSLPPLYCTICVFKYLNAEMEKLSNQFVIAWPLGSAYYSVICATYNTVRFCLIFSDRTFQCSLYACRFQCNISNPEWYSDDSGLELIPRKFDPSKDEVVAGKNYALSPVILTSPMPAPSLMFCNAPFEVYACTIIV